MRPCLLALGLMACGPSGTPQVFLRMVRADAAPALTLDVVALTGEEPPPGALEGLAEDLAGLLDKPGGVLVSERRMFPPGDDLDAILADAALTAPPVARDEVQIQVILLGSQSVGDDAPLAEALIDESVISVDQRRMAEHCAAAMAVASVEPEEAGDVCAVQWRRVLLHEALHLAGLVGRKIPLQSDHLVGDGSAHTREAGCLMSVRLKASSAAVDPFGAPRLCASTALDLSVVRDAPSVESLRRLGIEQLYDEELPLSR